MKKFSDVKKIKNKKEKRKKKLLSPLKKGLQLLEEYMRSYIYDLDKTKTNIFCLFSNTIIWKVSRSSFLIKNIYE